MILYYALGGGLGHLTRGRRVLEMLGIEATLVTASAYAMDARVTGGFPVIPVPADLEGDVDAHRQWLRALACERMIVDTFPCGIQGELSGLDVPMDLVARRLKWEEYRRAVPFALPKFERVYRVEELETAQEEAIAVIPSVERGTWAGGAAGTCFAPRPPRSLATLGMTGRFWLIVHSGPEDEVRELIAYAEELRRVHAPPETVLVATRCTLDLPENYEPIDAYPVAHLYEHAERIISAAGFNVMFETEPWRDKHHPIPFPRRFDDQFVRAARRRAL